MLETVWESRWLPDSCGGVAQLGEHLPCKQGVKSSNLSISIRILMIKFRDKYLENRILKIKDNSLKKYQDIRGDMLNLLKSRRDVSETKTN